MFRNFAESVIINRWNWLKQKLDQLTLVIIPSKICILFPKSSVGKKSAHIQVKDTDIGINKEMLN